MNFIEKLYLKKSDSQVHLQFQRFSKGIFSNRALINARRTGNKFTIATSAEFGNDFVREVAEKLKDKKTNIKGVIVSTSDLAGKLDFINKKQFQGVKSYVIDKEMSGNEIIKLLDEFPKAFFGLSFKADDTELKIKPKAPKSGKPKSNEDEKPKANFCKIITTDEKIGEGFVFEKKDFKKADIVHTFVIEDIVIPESLRKSSDFLLIREESKRKGKIIREAEIDGEKTKKEFEFEA